MSECFAEQNDPIRFVVDICGFVKNSLTTELAGGSHGAEEARMVSRRGSMQ